MRYDSNADINGSRTPLGNLNFVGLIGEKEMGEVEDDQNETVETIARVVPYGTPRAKAGGSRRRVLLRFALEGVVAVQGCLQIADLYPITHLSRLPN